MQTVKTCLKFSFTITLLSFLSFSTVGCLEQKASSSKEANQKKVENESKPNSGLKNSEVDKAQKTIDDSPNSSTGYSQLAVAYIRLARESGDFSLNSKAETALNRALEIDPEDPSAQKLKASLLLTFHRFSEALEAGTKLQQKYPQEALVYGVLTDANVELGNYEEAVESAQKMVDLKPNMESFARIAHIRSLYGETDGAILAMSQSVSMTHPMDKEALAWSRVYLGNEYFKAGKYKEAEAAYDIALKSFPEYHFALAGKGRARTAAGDYENAIKFLKQSQDRVPLTDTVIALGDLYRKTGNSEKADEQYELVEVIEQKLGLNNDQRALALFWADHDMKIDEALEVAAREKAARKDVYTADIYAWCLYKKGRYEEAKAAVTDAMRIKNKDARIFYHAGMIEKALGNKTEAKEFLQKALQTNRAFDLLQAETAEAVLRELN